MALAVCLVSAACGRRQPLTPEAARSLFLPRSVTVHGTSYGYRVYLPSHYTAARTWPVVLFLHGSAECGDDNLRQTLVGLGPAIAADRERFPALAVVPQCRAGRAWLGEMEEQAEAALDQTVAELNGDPERLSVTGISLGGTGAWFFARHPHRFAAVVPIAGEVVPPPDDPLPPNLPRDVARLVAAPDPFAALARAIYAARVSGVWAFHGARDDQVPVAQSRAMVSALRRLGGDPRRDPPVLEVRYTEYAFAGHNSWDRAYADPRLFRWLLAQRLH